MTSLGCRLAPDLRRLQLSPPPLPSTLPQVSHPQGCQIRGLAGRLVFAPSPSTGQTQLLSCSFPPLASLSLCPPSATMPSLGTVSPRVSRLPPPPVFLATVPHLRQSRSPVQAPARPSHLVSPSLEGLPSSTCKSPDTLSPVATTTRPTGSPAVDPVLPTARACALPFSHSFFLAPLSVPHSIQQVFRCCSRSSAPHGPANAALSIRPNGTVRGCWAGTDRTHAFQSLTDSAVELKRMPCSGLHRQAEIPWERPLAVNIWQTGRVHIQGKGAGNLALHLNAHSESTPRNASPSPETSNTDLAAAHPRVRSVSVGSDSDSIIPCSPVPVLQSAISLWSLAQSARLRRPRRPAFPGRRLFTFLCEVFSSLVAFLSLAGQSVPRPHTRTPKGLSHAQRK